MTQLAPTLEAYFTLRLIGQRNLLRGILRPLIAHIDSITDRLISC